MLYFLIPILILFMFLLQNNLNSLMTQVSQISLSSNINTLKSQQFSTSKFEQSTEGGQISNRTFNCKSTISKASILNAQINKIQQAQNQMEKKFQKCIESLIKQIQQKQTLNNRLLKELSELKQNIEQSKKDIQSIAVYVKKNIKSKNQVKNGNISGLPHKNFEMSGSIRSQKKSIQGKSSKKLLARGSGNK